MKENLSFYWDTVKKTYKSYMDSDVFIYAAGLAYSALFSLPGLLIIVIWLAGVFFGEDVVKGKISDQIASALDKDAAKSVENLIQNAMVDQDGMMMRIVGVLTLVFGATTLFFILQKTLNNLWGIEPNPKQAMRKYIIDRIKSLSVILIISLLMAASMILTAMLSSLSDYIITQFGSGTYTIAHIINFIIGLLLVVAVFAILFKMLPDAEIPWKGVISGAIATAILFTIGKYLLNYYFANFEPASAYGAAGTIVMIMIWINYSFLIMFFGAQFTKVYAMKRGFNFQPSDHAKWIDEEHAQLSKGVTANG